MSSANTASSIWNNSLRSPQLSDLSSASREWPGNGAYGSLTPSNPKSYSMGTCFICRAGTSTNFESSPPTCDACESGKFSSQDRSTSCTTCEEGKISGTGAKYCGFCPAGKYALSEEASLCIECPVGTFQPNPGRTSCQICSSGKYSDDIGAATPCSDCPAGKYIADEATAAASHDSVDDCLSCEAGKVRVCELGSDDLLSSLSFYRRF